MHTDKTLRLLLAIVMLIAFALVSAQAATPPKSHPTTTKPAVKVITVGQAEKIALKKYPGKIVEKTRLISTKGLMHYTVMIKSGNTLHLVMVNAKTGKIDRAEARPIPKVKKPMVPKGKAPAKTTK